MAEKKYTRGEIETQEFDAEKTTLLKGCLNPSRDGVIIRPGVRKSGSFP